MAKNTYIISWDPTNNAPFPHPTYVCDEHYTYSQRHGLNGLPQPLKPDDPKRQEQCRLCWMNGRDA